jgi:hypothetical protein
MRVQEYAQEVDVDFVRKVGLLDFMSNLRAWFDQGFAFCMRWVGPRQTSVGLSRLAGGFLSHCLPVLPYAGCARDWPLCCEP